MTAPNHEVERWSEQWTLGSNTAPTTTSTIALHGPEIYGQQEVEVVPKLEANQRLGFWQGMCRELEDGCKRLEAEREEWRGKAENRLHEWRLRVDDAKAAGDKADEAEAAREMWRERANQAKAQALAEVREAVKQVGKSLHDLASTIGRARCGNRGDRDLNEAADAVADLRKAYYALSTLEDTQEERGDRE